VLILAPYQAHRCCLLQQGLHFLLLLQLLLLLLQLLLLLLAFAAVQPFHDGGGGGQALVEEGEGGQAVKKRLHLKLNCPLLVCALPESLKLVCGPKACCFFKLAAVADPMGCNGLLSALENGCRCRPLAPKYFPSLFSLATSGFFDGGSLLILMC